MGTRVKLGSGHVLEDKNLHIKEMADSTAMPNHLATVSPASHFRSELIMSPNGFSHLAIDFAGSNKASIWLYTSKAL